MVISIDRSVIDIIEIYHYLKDKIEHKTKEMTRKFTKISINTKFIFYSSFESGS